MVNIHWTASSEFSRNPKGKMFISQETYEVMVSYVLKVGFYQDPPENYFGHQRSFGARKDNPSFRDFGFNDNAIRNQKVFPPIVMLEITIKVILNFHVSLFHTKKKLKRTKCKLSQLCELELHSSLLLQKWQFHIKDRCNFHKNV